MTYFEFLFRFLLIPILIFLAITVWDTGRKAQIKDFRDGRALWIAVGIHILLAVLYTTPWDNYLVATGVWFYNPDLVTGILIGYVPIEEYTFFFLETLLAGLWWWFLIRRSSPPDTSFKPSKSLIYLSTSVLAFLWLLSAYLFFFGETTWTYLSIILFWALPPLATQTLFGADILWRYRKLVARAILVPGLYLSLVDIVALRETTWSISTRQTTGVLFFGILPLEEVVFFFITNVLITFGMTLLLANLSEERFAEIRKQVRGWKERRMLDLRSR